MRTKFYPAVVSLLFLITTMSCGLFSPPKTDAALLTNTQMHAVFSSHSNAFEKLMLHAQMDTAVKAAILSNIQQDRQAFSMLHNVMSQYLGAIGQLTPEMVKDFVEKAKKIYGETKAVVEEELEAQTQ